VSNVTEGSVTEAGVAEGSVTEGSVTETTVTERQVAIPGVDGDLGGVLVEPRRDGVDARGAPAPVVVVLPEIDGFCAGTVAAARRLAESGYVALALDLYAPYGSAPRLRNYEDTMAWIHRLDDRHQMSDLAQALAWVRSRPSVDPDRLAVLGFSIGGRYGMMLTTEPHDVRAVVAFYTRPWPGAEIADIALAPGKHVAQFNAPVCALFGADDELVPLDMVEEFRQLLDQHSALGHQLHIVPGGHFYANESRTRRYHPASAEASWTIALDFLATQLGHPSPPPPHR
jgi:carboxymethylenebutenolidase